MKFKQQISFTGASNFLNLLINFFFLKPLEILILNETRSLFISK